MPHHEKKVRKEHPSTSPVFSDQSTDLIPVGPILLAGQLIARLARETGLVRRKPRKIPAAGLLGAVLAECAGGSPSYNDLASRIDDNDGCAPFRQAVSERVNEDFHTFLQSLLGHFIGMKVLGDAARCGLPAERFRGYRRVILRWSDCLAA